VAAGGAIKIGLVQPLTGVFANIGKDNQDGFNLYLESVNSTVAGRKIELSVVDDQGKADVGLTKARQLVESEGVKVLLGFTPTPVCEAVAGYVKDAHVPMMVTGNCGSQILTTNPLTKSPYVARYTQNNTTTEDPIADWAYKQGYRKATMFIADYGGGLDNADSFASAFVKRGGSIVQEQYPPQGTADFGPFLAKTDQSADVVYTFFPGVDGLRFLDQIGNYTTKSKPIVDPYSSMTNGPNLEQLKDKAIGVYAGSFWSLAVDTPENKAFIKAWQAKYPNRLLSGDMAQGYSGAQILVDTLKQLNGNIEDTPKFLDTLYRVTVQTAKGPVKLDADHDVVENIYLYQIVKDGNGYGHKLLDTIKGSSRAWDRSRRSWPSSRSAS